MKNEIKSLLEELKKELKVEKDIKIEFKKYKKLIASTSLDKQIIRINKKILNPEYVKKLGYENHTEFLTKVLKHELMHIKINSKWHIIRYFDELI